ncbi:hypothetical protein [Gemmobacter lutimaris]|jgi:hypothetical protein|uniref:hypothetical protein n=1 Tax=Gemmobacter lutimaris TaxID=2306023 RepID=UPI001313D9F2|nr:hypothetical protein [Gemmobacter lutimaris]
MRIKEAYERFIAAQAADTRPACVARQYSDQMVCAKCNLAWDVNDPEPPQCRAGSR